MKKIVAFVIGPKGGTGKSYVSIRLAEAAFDRFEKILCVDTDPVNHSFADHKFLKPAMVNILKQDKNIDTSEFDKLVEMIITGDQEITIVDTGGNTFLPLGQYMEENEILSLLADSGVDVILIAPIAGGSSLQYTLAGLQEIINLGSSSSSAKVAAIVNEFFGNSEVEGQPVEDWMKKNKIKIDHFYRLANRSKDTFGKDIETIGKKHLIIQEVLAGLGDFSIVQKQRLGIVRKEFDEILNGLLS